MESEKVKELREKFKKVQYATSLEKDLLQELDETKDIEKRMNLTKRIEEVRETKSESVTAQIIEDAEKGREEAKTKIEENRAKIETLKSRNEKLEEEEKAFVKEILENEGIMELKKANPSSKIYISAKEENESLLKRKKSKISQKKRNQNKIEKLGAEIEDLEDEILGLDDLLCEIKGEKIEELQEDEIQQQEDEMWEQYRLEQEKERQEQERKKQEEIDKAFEDKELAERAEYEAVQKWLNGDELAKDTTTAPAQAPTTVTRPTTKPTQTPTPVTKPTAKPVQTPTSVIKPTAKPVQAPTPVTKPTTAPAQTPTPVGTPTTQTENKEKCEIKQVGFRIQSNGKPEYYVIFTRDGELDTESYDALQYINKVMEKDVYRLKNVEQPKKYFDIGLEEILGKFDFAHKTNYVDKYIESMAKDAKVEDRGFRLSYDFYNLSLYSPKDNRKLKHLRNIAKNNKRAGLAEYYKSGSLLKRIETRIKSSKFYSKYFLPAPVEYETVKESTNEQVKDSFEQLHDEPGFDIETFIKQNNFSDKTASEYRDLKDKKGKEWRESLKAIKETKRPDLEPDFDEIFRTVEEIQQEEEQEK